MEHLKKRKLIFILSILGLAVSSYLAYYKYSLNTGFFVSCGFEGCATVQMSKYSELFGIPIAVYGILYYVVMMYLINHKNDMIKKIWLVWGLAFSSYLTYLELFKIKAICPWCLVSYIIIVLMNIIYFTVPTKDPVVQQDKEPAHDSTSS